MMRGYHRRRGWAAWHTAALGRAREMPPLHELTGHAPPPEESDEEREARIYRNSMAWVIVTGGNAVPPQAEPAPEPEPEL